MYKRDEDTAHVWLPCHYDKDWRLKTLNRNGINFDGDFPEKKGIGFNGTLLTEKIDGNQKP
jgi:hypothetical protein